jgi:hypothetical protein
MNRPSFLRIAFTMVGALCASVAAAPQAPSSKPQRITEEHRVTLIRELQAEHAFTKIAFPQGKKGVTIKDGKMSPGEMEVSRLVMKEGAAANVGDRVLITNLIFDGDKLILEINGGPRKGVKWYQRISVSGGGADVPIARSDGRAQTSQGSVVTLVFHDYIPDVSPDDVRQLLSSVLDFTAMTVAEAYAKALPPKVQEAIKNHKVLVGMDRDMVQYSLGRPPKRYRDKDDKGRDYEEWIYGVPPEEVQFVRFIGPTVAQLTVMQVSGEKVVKTEPEVELAAKQNQPKPEDEAGPVKKKTKRPTLLAPGETGPDGKTVPDPKAPDSSSPDATSSPHFASKAP